MVKKQDGITLMSLVIYVLTVTIVTSILIQINFNFSTNYSKLKDEGNDMVEFNNFNAQLLKDIKQVKTTIVAPSGSSFSNQTTFTLEDGTTYTYDSENKGIYRNEVKICSYVVECRFSKITQTVLNTHKEILGVYITFGEGDQVHGSKNMEYVLKYY
ncbi:MAG: hypothetical protein Q4G05_00495 [Clostridia bacterium]|nr:hypothetical protein [Clostridia bacterium]